MWVVRELLRLVFQIAFAAAIAIIIAGFWAFVSGGDFTRAMRIMLFLVGGLLLLLSGTGSKTTMSSRRVNWGVITPIAGNPIFRGVTPRPGEPTLTAGAVFAGSGAVLIVLGLMV
jgi:hypothetical protein